MYSMYTYLDARYYYIEIDGAISYASHGPEY